MRINENVAYAKSILNKNGITSASEEWTDYLKIRVISRQNSGNVGILTKLRFIDKVSDMSEIESIFDILKNSKIDINKLNKLSYDEILDIFYDELGGKVDKTDFELIYKDDKYSYYRVYTYQGILKIGSPAWCLKTKSHWDQYQKSHPEQWVVISNKYRNKLLTPDNNYIDDYRNTKKGWVRYGISIKVLDDDKLNFVAFSDNNTSMNFTPGQWTFYGVMTTVLNLKRDIKKSYYERFAGCKKIDNSTWLEVEDEDFFLKRMRIGKFQSDGEVQQRKIYVKFSKEYDKIPIILIFTNSLFCLFVPSKLENFSSTVDIDTLKSIQLMNYAIESDSPYYLGIKLKLGIVSMEEIENITSFVKKVDKWLIFNIENFYLVVNTMEGGDEMDIPVYKGDSVINATLNSDDMDNPMCWYINKQTMQPIINKLGSPVKIKDFHRLVYDAIEQEQEPKKIKNFFNFRK
jgi:hypothetical protein